MLISIETYRTSDFPGGLDPLSPLCLLDLCMFYSCFIFKITVKQPVICPFFFRLLGSDKNKHGLIGGSDLNLDIHVQDITTICSFT